MVATKRARGWFFGGEEPEWLVVASVVLALALGWVLMTVVTQRSTHADLQAVSLRYPADWVLDETSDTAWSAAPLGSTTRMSVSILRELDPAAPVSLDDVLAQLGFSQGRYRTLFRVLATERTSVAGRTAGLLRYAYVSDGGALGGMGLPVVVEGADYVLPHQGKVYLLSFEADANEFEALSPTLDRILRSVRLD